MILWNWFLHYTGTDNTSGHWYGWWSGAGSDVAELALIGGLWHHLNCHEPGCWRPGRHMVVEDGGVHVRRCRKHHTARVGG